MKDTYEDLLYLPYRGSKNHPKMSLQDRAAQFSPFAALSGYESVLRETARLTEEEMVLDDYTRAELDEKMQFLLARVQEHPEASFTYFQPDDKKEGGAYISITGHIRKIDTDEKFVLLLEGPSIDFDRIVSISSPLFPCETRQDKI